MRLDEITHLFGSVADMTCKSGLETAPLWKKFDFKESVVTASLAMLPVKVFLDSFLNDRSASVQIRGDLTTIGLEPHQSFCVPVRVSRISEQLS